MASLEGGRIIARGEGELCIAVPTPFSARRLNHKRSELEAACARFFGRGVRVEIEVAGSGGAPGNGAADAESLRSRRQEALEHPAVNLALDLLDGQIVEIRPLGGPR